MLSDLLTTTGFTEVVETATLATSIRLKNLMVGYYSQASDIPGKREKAPPPRERAEPTCGKRALEGPRVVVRKPMSEDSKTTPVLAARL
jgi:hypothetical protein